jgi:hypothetical protein
MRTWFPIFACIAFLASAMGAEKYTGPRPAKADLPYLMHAAPPRRFAL